MNRVPAPEQAAPPAGHSRRGLLRRHPLIAGSAALLVVLLLVAGGWVLYVNSELGNIPRFPLDLNRKGRPARTVGNGMNILLVGTDFDGGDDVRHVLADGQQWPPGLFRSDTMMVLHLSADRSHDQLISLPRDLWVPIPGHGTSKLNAAFSWGGPKLLAETLENDYGVYLDHVAIIDFAGFKEMTGALGGVDVTVAGHGTEHLQGASALAYVRERKSLPGGDFDRIRRQQNFLRAVADKLRANGTLRNPIRLTALARSLGGLLALDSRFTTGLLRSTAFALARHGGGDLTFLTVPHGGTGMVGGASVVFNEPANARALFAAVSRDDFANYRRSHRIDELPAPGRVR